MALKKTITTLAGHACAYDLEGENPMKQAYAHIKTLPQYDGAQDY